MALPMDISPAFATEDAPENILRLFDSTISATAETLVTKTLYSEKLAARRAEYKTMLQTYTLPAHAPASIKQLLEKTSSSNTKLHIVKSFLDLDDLQVKQVTIKAEIDVLKNNFHDKLLTLATGRPAVLAISKAQADASLHHFTVMHNIKKRSQMSKHATKKLEDKIKIDKKKQEAAASLTAASDPASLAKKIQDLEKTISQLKRQPKAGNKHKRDKKKQAVRFQRHASPAPKSNNSGQKRKQAQPKRKQTGMPVPSAYTRSSNLALLPHPMPLSSASWSAEEAQDLGDMITVTNNGFTSLSTFNLPSSVVKMLGYGIKHIPQPNPLLNSTVLTPILNILSDKISWRFYFEFIAEDQPYRIYNPKFRLPLTPFTKYSECPALRQQISVFKTESLATLTSSTATPVTCNYTVQTIKKLSATTPELKFVAADKNLGLVMLDTLHYHKLVMTHLDNTLNYSCIGDLISSQPIIEAIIKDYYRRLDALVITDLTLTEQEKRFISLRNIRLPQFHILAKIHKTPLKGRPIVGATSWITTNAAKYLDNKLQAYLSSFPSILYNTQDFINRWSTIQFDNTTEWLVSLDVESLYTNISLDSVYELLDQLNFPLSNLFRLLSNFNYFSYNDKLYHQIDGIAMGSNCAVSIANIYMGTYIDLPISRRHQVVFKYCRFIDDVALVFKGTEDELDALYQQANQLHPGLTFTIVKDRESLDVLDVTFYNDSEQTTLQYRTYQKPINKFLYIPYFSHHPLAVLRGFVLGELLRYRRTNSNHHTLNATNKAFYIRLLARGYSHTFLDFTFREARSRAIAPSSRPRLDPNKDWIVSLPYSTDENTKNLIRYWRNNAAAVLPAPYTLSRLTTAWSPAPSLGKLLLRSSLSKEQQEYIKSNSN